MMGQQEVFERIANGRAGKAPVYSFAEQIARFLVDPTIALMALNYLKIDAEGADLDILIGAVGCLPAVLALQVEVAFIERNIGTSLQPNIDLCLRTNGFVLHRLVG